MLIFLKYQRKDKCRGTEIDEYFTVKTSVFSSAVGVHQTLQYL